MRLYQFYSVTTANTSIQMLMSGTIVAVAWSAYCGTITTGDGLICELSTQGAIQNAVNNPNGVISIFRHSVLAPTGASVLVSTANFFHASLSMPIKLGDFLYLNTVLAGATSSVRCLVHVA